MTCDAMLERMLDAEPSELEGKGGTILARHVRECDRCAAVARHLRSGEAGLASVIARSPRRATIRAAAFGVSARCPRYVTPASIGTALIAASALFLLLRSGDVRAPDINARRIAAPEVPEVTGVGPLSATTPRADAAPAVFAAPPKSRNTARPRRVLPRRLDGATAVVAAAIPAVDVRVAGLGGVESVARAALRTGDADVVVDPPPGVRATVMRGNAPGVTVVWLH